MPRLQPKPKDRRKVPIPDELRDSLREVFELIQEAKIDPDIQLDFDDAIQVGAVCGGRYGEKPRRYVLTYFPKGENERGRWHLALHHTEIEDIGDGRMTEILMYCCTSPECRCKFRQADDHCFYCDYIDDPSLGVFGFPEAAAKLAERGIARLSENSTRDDVVALLGSPDATGGDLTVRSLGYIGPWLEYRRPDCRLRFEFDKAQTRIRKLAIMEKDWEPGQ